MPPARSLRRSLGALALGLVVLLTAACSDADRDATASTTTASPPASSKTTTVDSVTTTSGATSDTEPDGTTASVPTPTDAISVAVYWTRPADTARPIDIPAYHDPAGGPYPYVLYGSVTNAGGATIERPRVAVDWYADGTSIHQTTVDVVDPQGQPLDELAAGASADLVVVVADSPVAVQLADAQPSFGLAAS